MKRFERELITEWRRLGLPIHDATLVVGVSGGADSVSLLLGLCELVRRAKLSIRLVSAHIEHGLRGAESAEDAVFVSEIAASLGIDHETRKAKIPRIGNLEENARVARYGLLARIARSNGAFAVAAAHTLNDQAETLLMNLIRGSGPAGLAGMRSVRPLEREILLVRPLLRWAGREDTEEYCRSRGIEPRHDAMNDDRAFTRVRVRRELLPLLRTYNPKIVATLARTAELMPSASETEFSHGQSLAVRDISDLDGPLADDLIRGWLNAQMGSTRRISHKHITAIRRLALSTKSGKEAELPGGASVRKRSGELKFVRK